MNDKLNEMENNNEKQKQTFDNKLKEYLQKQKLENTSSTQKIG